MYTGIPVANGQKTLPHTQPLATGVRSLNHTALLPIIEEITKIILSTASLQCKWLCKILCYSGCWSSGGSEISFLLTPLAFRSIAYRAGDAHIYKTYRIYGMASLNAKKKKKHRYTIFGTLTENGLWELSQWVHTVAVAKICNVKNRKFHRKYSLIKILSLTLCKRHRSPRKKNCLFFVSLNWTNWTIFIVPECIVFRYKCCIIYAKWNGRFRLGSGRKRDGIGNQYDRLQSATESPNLHRIFNKRKEKLLPICFNSKTHVREGKDHMRCVCVCDNLLHSTCCACFFVFSNFNRFPFVPINFIIISWGIFFFLSNFYSLFDNGIQAARAKKNNEK